MICSKCQCKLFTIPVSTTHYLCKAEENVEEFDRKQCVGCDKLSVCERVTGCGAQFQLIEDNHIRFPHATIFSDRGAGEFFRKPDINTIRTVDSQKEFVHN